MKKKLHKPYFRAKGRYADGRKRMVIESETPEGIKSFALPKPEKLLYILKLFYGQVKKVENYEQKVGQKWTV